MTESRSRRRRDAHDIDDIDEALIGLLQVDGRRTYGDLAKEVGLSEAAARQRVNRLRTAGTLRVVAVTDPIRLGLRTVAMVGVKVSGDARAAARALARVDAIEYVVLVAGAYDILAEVVCEDEHRLLDIINDEIRVVEGVVATESYMFLHIEKQVFAWGARSARVPPA